MADRVFIIGANSCIRGQLASAFTEAGFVSAGASSYPEALTELEKFKPDVVIIDEALTSGDNLEACSELSNDFNLPVIVLGVDASNEVWQKVIEAGVDLYQTKPFNNVLLIARVRAILRRYRGQMVQTSGLTRDFAGRV